MTFRLLWLGPAAALLIAAPAFAQTSNAGRQGTVPLTSPAPAPRSSANVGSAADANATVRAAKAGASGATSTAAPIAPHGGDQDFATSPGPMSNDASSTSAPPNEQQPPSNTTMAPPANGVP